MSTHSLSIALFSAALSGALLSASVTVHLIQQDPSSTDASVVPSSTLPSADFISPDINFNVPNSDGSTTAIFLNHPTFTNQQNGFNPDATADNLFLEISAQTYLNTGINSFVLGHDDGVVLAFTDPSIGTVVNAPGPTGFVGTPFNVNAPTAGLYAFDLKYTECCGGPAVLLFNINGSPIGPGTGTPEPINLAILGLALIGLSFLTKRRRPLAADRCV